MQDSTALIAPQRLVKRDAFVRVQGTGKRYRGQHLCVLAVPAQDRAPALGFTVSRRVGNAVVRNHVRRRLKEIVRLDCDRVIPDSEIVIIAFPSAAQASYESLRSELVCLFDKARNPAPKPASS